jgi:hypothetical protein
MRVLFDTNIILDLFYIARRLKDRPTAFQAVAELLAQLPAPPSKE